MPSAVDNRVNKAPGVTGPARSAFAITPHATNELAFVTRAVWVGGAGTLVCTMADDGTEVTFAGIPAGTLLPIQVKKVNTTSSGTLIIGLY